jgi:hypothetical protein
MKPVEEGSPVVGSIDVLRPVNGDRFLVSFFPLCRGLGRHVVCLLWDAVAVSFLALARCWATEVEARSDRWRLGHRRRGVDLQHLWLRTASSSVAPGVGAGHNPWGAYLLTADSGVEGSGPGGPARWRHRRLAAGAVRTSRGIPEQFVLAIGVVKARGVSVALLVAIWSRTCPRRSVRLPT